MPRLTVINKIDLLVKDLSEANEVTVSIDSPAEKTVVVSASKNWNLDRLLEKIEEII